MQYWIELGLVTAAGISILVVTLEGLRIFAGWRRSGARTVKL